MATNGKPIEEDWRKIPMTRKELTGLNLVSYNDEVVFITPATFFQLDSLHKVYMEIWLEKIYAVFPVNGEHVVDVGGFLGDSALYFILNGAKFVDIYEPGQTGGYIDINMAINRIPIEMYALHDEAVTGETGQIDANLINFNWGQTSFERDNVLAGSGFKKKTVSLYDIAVQDAILKMDTEGSEYLTFERADKDTIRKFKAIMLEFHNKGHGAISDKLKECGFEITAISCDYGREAKDTYDEHSGMLYAKRID